jgi:hypothetical protein
MPARYSQKKRGLACNDESNSMVNDNPFKREFLDRLLSKQLQLMLGHCLVRFVFDSVDLAPVLRAANSSPKIDYRTSRTIDMIRRRFEPRFR